MKKYMRRKKIVVSVILLGLVVLLISSYQPILTGAGRFLAPAGTGKADVVILEGEELVKGKAVKIGIELLSSGSAKRMVVVLHQYEEDEKIFGLDDYSLLLVKNLQNLKIRRDQFLIIEVPTSHPITLTEARIVLANLSSQGVKSAILVAQGFHTRRSFWAYKQTGLPLGIEVIPFPYFTDYRNENWWQRADGFKGFFSEYMKLFYYLVRGYIPVKSLVTT
jgi:uncharacterized SAM-binding protein YcdF (DUF218 family)